MKKLNCLIVDDEPPAVRLLKSYVERVAFLHLKETTNSALEALKIIEEKEIDLVLLDIQMPELTGIQLSKLIKGQTAVIFTTAYPQFALESYELNALDYLLKPIEFERFYEAVLKLDRTKQTSITEADQQNEDFLFVKTDGKNKFEKLAIHDILYVEGVKNYVAIHLPDRSIITYNTLKNIESSLPSQDFFKIHKSYIVAFRHVLRTSSYSVHLMNHKELPISDTYRKAFFEQINERSL